MVVVITAGYAQNSIFQNRVLFRVFQEDDDGTGFPLYNPVEYGDQARFGSITYDKVNNAAAL